MLKIALHYGTNGSEDYDGGTGRHWSSEPVQASINSLVEAGLLVDQHLGANPTQPAVRYVRTDGMRVWIEALTGVPFPELVQMWVMPNMEGNR